MSASMSRWNAGDAALARTYAAQLIGLQPDVILSASTTNLIDLRQATNTIPIVFVQVSDPVAQGFVSNLTRPGGNLTGFSAFDFSIGGKWVDLLKQVKPELARVAVVYNQDTAPQTRFFMPSIESAAPVVGRRGRCNPGSRLRGGRGQDSRVRPAAERRRGFSNRRAHYDAPQAVIELVSRHRLPAIAAS